MREKFGSRFTLVMALAGSAVGLGNIWRFPYMMGEYGGGAFVVMYLVFSIFITLPIFFCESAIGRRGGKSIYDSMQDMTPAGSKWKYTGYLCILTCFIIMSFYSVVGGWSLDFLVRSVFVGFNADGIDEVPKIFGKMSSSVWEPFAAAGGFLSISAAIVVVGVKNGIEKFTKWTMPALFILIVALAFYSVSLPGASDGVKYLLRPDFSKVNMKTASYALGQSFFSLSLGCGCVAVYSSFMKKDESILKTSIFTSVCDTLFAVIAGFVVMPAVFAAGLEPGAGPALVFESIPYIFAKISASSPLVGRVVSIFFFLAVLLAAITSEISLFEVCVQHFVDRRKTKRWKASLAMFTGCFVLALFCSLSFGPLADFKFAGQTVFGFCDVLSSNYLMTLGALLISLFAGWKMGRKEFRDEFTNSGKLKFSDRIFPVLWIFIKWVCPIGIFVIFFTNLLF